MRRMSTWLLAALFASAAMLFCLSPAYAAPNTTIDLLSNAGVQIDGQKVVIQGEVVGDIINAESGYKWLTMQDGGASLSVRVSDVDAEKITNVGRYAQIGTHLEVSGVFHADCFDHDGLTDLHADSVVVIDPGRKLPAPFNQHLLIVGGLLLVVGACLIFIHWRLRKRTL